MLYYIQKVHNNEIINMKGSATMANKFDDFLNAIKMGELMHRKSPAEKKKNTLVCILAIIGAIAAIAWSNSGLGGSVQSRVRSAV